MNTYRENLLKTHRKPNWDKSHGCFTVAKLVKLFNAKVMAEVGVCVGHTATEVLAENKLKKYYMIDHWKDEKKYSLIVDNFQECYPMREDSIKAIKHFSDEKFDLVYIETIHTYSQSK